MSNPSPETPSARIALVTDTHFWFGAVRRFGAGDRQLQPHSQLLWDELLRSLREQGPQLILHLGDVTCGGGGYDMPAGLVSTALQTVRDGLRALDCPALMIPGNHDCVTGEGFRPTEELLGLGPGLGASFTLREAGLHVELLHTSSPTAAELAAAAREDTAPIHGRVSEAELARLEGSLKDAAGLDVIVCTHQMLLPLSGWREPETERMMVANRNAVLRLLAAHGRVRAVFQGHSHVYDVHRTRLGEGACTAVVVPALIQWPCAWLLLTARPDRLEWRLQPLRLPARITDDSRRAVHADRDPRQPDWNPWRLEP